MGINFVLFLWFLEILMQICHMLFALFLRIALPVASVVLRLIFVIIYTYPKIVLGLGGIAVLVVVVISGLSQRNYILPTSVNPLTRPSLAPTALTQPIGSPSLQHAPPITRPQPEPTRVVTRDLNLRGGPGINYPVLQVLAQGTQVRLISEPQQVADSTWVMVRVADVEGWVNHKFLK